MGRSVRHAVLSAAVCAFLAASVSSAFAASAPAAGARTFAAAARASAPAGMHVAAATDDWLPGDPYDVDAVGPNSVISDTLAVPTDLADVRSIWLMAGERVTFTISGDAGTDFGLLLFEPWATAADPGDPAASIVPAHWSGTASYPRSVTYTADASGEYFLDVATWVDDQVAADGGSGSYTLSIDFERQLTAMSLDPVPSTLDYGDSFYITGGVGGRFWDVVGDVYCFWSYDGLKFYPWVGAPLSGGGFSVDTGFQDRKTWYTVVFEGNTANASCVRTVVINSRASVGNPVAPSTMYRRTAKTVYGYLKPKHTAGSYPVRIYMYRYVSGKWKSYGYAKAKASDYNGYTKYAASMKLPATGKWRLRAYAPADSGHVGTWSAGYDYVTAK